MAWWRAPIISAALKAEAGGWRVQRQPQKLGMALSNLARPYGGRGDRPGMRLSC